MCFIGFRLQLTGAADVVAAREGVFPGPSVPGSGFADDGGRVGQIAGTLGVSVSYVSKVLSRRHAAGETSARPQRSHLTPKLAELHEAIRAEVAAHPDGTIAELRRSLSETHKVVASEGLMHARWRGLT